MFFNFSSTILLIFLDIVCLISIYFIGYHTGKTKAKSEFMDIELKTLQQIKYKETKYKGVKYE